MIQLRTCQTQEHKILICSSNNTRTRFTEIQKIIIFLDQESTLVRNAQDDLNELNYLFCVNKLSITINKTNFIIFGLKPLTDQLI